MAQGGEAFVFQSYRLGDEGFAGAAFDVAVDAGGVAHFATEQLVDWNVVELAFDVPEGDVDGGDGAVDRGAGEMVRSQHHIPMVLDGARVLAEQVFSELSYRGGAGFEV